MSDRDFVSQNPDGSLHVVPLDDGWQPAATIDKAKDGRQVIVRYIGRDGVSSRFACVRWLADRGQWTMGRNPQDEYFTLGPDPVEWCELPGGYGST